MDAFFGFLKVLAVCATLFFVVFLVLLALPKSQLRSLVLEFFGWITAGGSAVLVVSPVDIIPDPIPFLGQMDDVAYIVVGIISGLLAYFQRKSRQQLVRGS